MHFRDLTAQYMVLKEEIDEAIAAVIARGDFIMGAKVTELEASLAGYVGVKHCVTCANGTDALFMVLLAWGVKPGDAVFVPDFTFFATAEVVSLLGAVPIFVDVDADTFNMDAQKLEEQILKVLAKGHLTPRVIITVDLFGLPADYTSIVRIANKYDLLVLEDAAQGFGGSINGKKACSFGDAAVTSFFPAKPLGCYGDGGAVFTGDDSLAGLLKSIRVHGKGTDKYDNVRIGVNSRLDTLQAAILIPKFKAFAKYELEKVNEIAQKYTQKLSSIVKTPTIPVGYYSSWAQYTIVFESGERRNLTQSALKKKGIPTEIYYPLPLHKQSAYKELESYNESYPVADMLCKRVLSLPMHPYLTDGDVDLITQF